MPGICAISRPSGAARHQLDAMVRRMSHFEWFKSATYFDDQTDVGIGWVGFPSAEKRATHSLESSLAVVDGEIYNSGDQRQRLENIGVRLSSSSDAEALLWGWRRDGPSFFGRLNGLFSAVIWNANRREIVVLTDRFGMKPIYVARTSGGFLVASEIQALTIDPAVDRTWSPTGVAEFFGYGHFITDATLFEGVRAVPPATCLVYRVEDGRLEETKYWEPNASREPGDRQMLAEKLEQSLVNAVHRRAHAGERLGLSLSGGLDARTLLGLTPRPIDLTTVSLGMEGSIDHRGAAALAKLAGVPHHCFILDDSFLAKFEEHLRSMIALTDGHYVDQGIVMPTLSTYRDLGIEFLLRGHGGELLHMRKAYSFSLDGRAITASDSELREWLYEHLTAYMLGHVPDDLFTVDIGGAARASLEASLERTKAFDRPVDRVWQLFVNARLHRETAMSMQMFGNYATIRLPYIDNDVIDTVYAMPADMKLGDELQTRILSRLCPAFLGVVNSNTGAKMGAGRLASEMARFQMRVKAKLGVRGYQPYERLGLWLREQLQPLVKRVVLGEELLSRSLVRPDAVKRVVNQHMNRQANHTYLLMALLIFELGQQIHSRPAARFAAEESVTATSTT